jgi:hypothetical protein
MPNSGKPELGGEVNEIALDSIVAASARVFDQAFSITSRGSDSIRRLKTT